MKQILRFTSFRAALHAFLSAIIRPIAVLAIAFPTSTSLTQPSSAASPLVPVTGAADSTVTGTLASVGVESTVLGLGPEIATFVMTNQPTSTGCPSSIVFMFTAADVTDSNTRKNMLATLLAARVSGASVTVVYSGSYCDSQFGYPIPIAIGM